MERELTIRRCHSAVTELQFKNITDDIGYVPKRSARLILWTEKGTARHAKILNTEQAWEFFEQLEDCYFAVKKNIQVKPKAQTKYYWA